MRSWLQRSSIWMGAEFLKREDRSDQERSSRYSIVAAITAFNTTTRDPWLFANRASCSFKHFYSGKYLPLTLTNDDLLLTLHFYITGDSLIILACLWMAKEGSDEAVSCNNLFQIHAS